MRTVSRTDFHAPCMWAGFLDANPAFICVDGRSVIIDESGQHEKALHEGDVLVIAESHRQDGVWTAGEEGHILRMGANGNATCMADVERTWVSALAVHDSGLFAYAFSRTVVIQHPCGAIQQLALERPAEALSFDRQGRHLAIGCYDMIIVQTLKSDKRIELESKGVPTRVEFSPDARFIIVASRDATLYGWCLETSGRFRMVGYGRPVRDWSWSADQAWLVTDAGNGGVAWTFDGDNGPIGKKPVLLGDRTDQDVVAVHCHPLHDWVAMGYGDGLMVLESFAGDTRAILGQSDAGGVSCLRWRNDGKFLVFGTESGMCGVIESSK